MQHRVLRLLEIMRRGKYWEYTSMIGPMRPNLWAIWWASMIFMVKRVLKEWNLVSIPFTGSPIEGFAMIDQIIHGSHGFFDGSLVIRSMTEDEVDIVQLRDESSTDEEDNLQTLQWSIASFDDMLSGKASVIDSFSTPKNFGASSSDIDVRRRDTW
jgi:hypothetical protein